MKTPVWIGIDMGTTGVRAVAYQPDGHSYCEASREYPLHTPHPGWAEQDPDDILSAMEKVLIDVASSLAQLGHKPEGLAISSVFHSFLAYDKDWHPLTSLLTWADSRSQEIVQEMKKDYPDFLSIYRRTGCPLHPMYPMTKIAWLRKERPDIFKHIVFFGSIKDYAFRFLTGQWVVDRSIASGSGLYNLFSLEWDRELLRFLNISAGALPEVVSTTYSQHLHSEVARRTGLPAGIPVVIGAGDGVLVNVGIGAVQPGFMSATIGTSGAVRMLTDEPRTDVKGRTWCYNLTDKAWVVGGAINNGGIALRWVRDKFSENEQRAAEKLGIDTYDLLTHNASIVSAGSDGLIMLPFFTGERAPNWNADARGVIFGLTLNHGKNHLIRATMEGICYRMNSILLALEEVTGPAREIRASGSFIRAELWLQILADVFNQDVIVPNVNEGAAFGAAVLGFVSSGVLKDISATADFVTIEKTFKPRAEEVKTYKQLYKIYDHVYWNLQQEFTDIAAIQRKNKS
jgi:gluconokinase